MNNPAIFYEDKIEIPYLEYPLLNTNRSTVIMSTRNHDIVVKHINEPLVDYTPLKMRDFTITPSTSLPSEISRVVYSTPQSGITLVYPKGGIKDVYSILLSAGVTTSADSITERYNIFNLSEWLYQFPSLYSIALNFYVYNIAGNHSNLYVDFALIPKYIKKVLVENIDVSGVGTNVNYNISNTPIDSQLEYFNVRMRSSTASWLAPNIYGNLARLPRNIKYFFVRLTLSSATFSYTPGRVWRADFDTFVLYKTLTATQIDNILIDMAASITSAVGDKLIKLQGTRTNVSDSAVTYLQGLGFTVTVATAL